MVTRNMIFDKQIGERLKIARINAGYSSAKLFAQKNNIAYVTYSQYEAGKRRISADSILKFAKLLSVSASWLLTGYDETKINDISEYGCSDIKISDHNILHPNSQNQYIDANFLGDVFDEVNEMLKLSKNTLTDRDKIILSVELYTALSMNNQSIAAKKSNLKILINSIKKLKLEEKFNKTA